LNECDNLFTNSKQSRFNNTHEKKSKKANDANSMKARKDV